MNKDDIIAKLMAIPDEEQPLGSCKLCINGQGYITQEDGTIILCECSKKRRMHKLWTEAGVKPEYFDMTLANWNLKQDANGNDLGFEIKAKQFAHTFMKKYLACLPAICAGYGLEITSKYGASEKKNKYQSAIFYGGHKSGKTLLLSIAIMKAIEIGRTAKMYNWKDELRPVFVDFSKADRIEEIAKEFKKYDVIAIDGLTLYDAPMNKQLAIVVDRLADIRVDSRKPILIGCESVDYRAVEAYTSWAGLFDTCYPIRLPGITRE